MEYAGITLRYQGEQKIVSVLDKVASPTERVKLMDGIGAYGVSSTQQRFMDKASPEGQPWKPSLRAKEKGGQTLRESTRLYNSFTWEATKDMAAWGTNVAYAGIHQLGGVILPKVKKALAFRLANGQFVLAKKVTMPARPFLGINDRDSARIGDIGGDWLKKVTT